MANYATLKSAIQQVIKTNGNNEITGLILQQTLIAMIESLGGDYQFVGVAKTTTNPGTPDTNVAYIAGPGTYPNFSGLVLSGKVNVLKYNGTWVGESIYDYGYLETLMGRTRIQKFNGFIDTSNIRVYGTAKFVVVPVMPGDSVSISRISGGAFIFTKTFDPGYTLPFTPDYATGGGIVETNVARTVVAPEDAFYLLLRADSNTNANRLPAKILINGFDVATNIYNADQFKGYNNHGILLNGTLTAECPQIGGDNWSIECLIEAPIGGYQNIFAYRRYYMQVNATGAVKMIGASDASDKVVDRTKPFHVVFTHTDQNVCVTYVNGVKVAETTVGPDSRSVYYPDYLRIGVLRAGYYLPTNIKIYHFRVFNKILSQADATAFYNNGVPEKYVMPDSYYIADLTGSGCITELKNRLFPFAWLDESGFNNHLLPSETLSIIRAPISQDQFNNEILTEIKKNSAFVDSFPKWGDLTVYNGWIDSSNKILNYGQSTYRVVPVTGGSVISVENRSGIYVEMFVVSDFTFNPTLPYTPVLATGETGRRHIGSFRTFEAPQDAKYLLVSNTGNTGLDYSPATLTIDGYDVLRGLRDQVRNLQGKIDSVVGRGKTSLIPVKASKIYRRGHYWQGVCQMGEYVVGFGSGEDDHSTNGQILLFDLNLTLVNRYHGHNLGHCNSMDYNPDVETLVTTSSEIRGTTTHSPKIFLVKNPLQKILNEQRLDYDGADTIMIQLTNLNGLYTGLSVFGETSDFLYLCTIENPSSFTNYTKRWIYKIVLGKGANNMLTLFPQDSFGTFISGKEDTEYNGTAHILAVKEFESKMEIQGGKFVNGALLFSTDIYENSVSSLQAFLVKYDFDKDLNEFVLSERLWLNTQKNDMTYQRTESEECVVIGNRVLHQVIIHATETNYYRVFEYYL